MIASPDHRRYHIACNLAFGSVLVLAAGISALPGSMVTRDWPVLSAEVAGLFRGCMMWLESTMASEHLINKWSLGALIVMVLISARFGAAFIRLMLVTRRFVGCATAGDERTVPTACPEALRTKIRVVASATPFCFTSGWLRPRVLVSTGFIALLDPEELEAALQHEHYHVIHRDPLKILLSRSLTRAFWLFPILRDLTERYLVDKELAADQFAVARCRDRWSLASALVKLLRAGAPAQPPAIAAFTGTNQLRLQSLLGQAAPPRPWLPFKSVARSIAAALLLLPAAAALAWGIDALVMACARWMPGF